MNVSVCVCVRPLLFVLHRDLALSPGPGFAGHKQKVPHALALALEAPRGSDVAMEMFPH